MKWGLLFFAFYFNFGRLNAGGVYRKFLLYEVYHEAGFTAKPNHEGAINYRPGPAAYIPRFETPRGAIFCRMEDKVTRATKVWLKIGVQ